MESLNKSANNLPAIIPQKSTFPALSKDVALMAKQQIAPYVQKMIQEVTLPVAIENGAQLTGLLESKELAQGAKQQLSAMMNDVALFFGATDSFSADARAALASSIIAQYGNLNVEEIALAIQYGKAGKFGKDGAVYGALKASDIMKWLTLYSNSDEKLMYWERQNMQQPKEPESVLDLLGASVQNGRIKLEAPNPELIAEINAIKPAPGTAAWHRAEAERLEAREQHLQQQQAEKLKAFRAKGEKLVGAAQAEAEFKAFAKENYYDSLTKREQQILADAERGPVAATDIKKLAELNQRWQQLITDWTNRPLFPLPDIEE
jgi:hypothetical protein